MGVSPEVIVESFPAKLVAATLVSVLGVLVAGLSFAGKWLIAQDRKRELRLEALEKTQLAHDKALETKAAKADLGAGLDRLTAALNASEAAQNRQHTQLATTVAVMSAVAEERRARHGKD